MTAKQTIFRSRRIYNQWVANETLEDFALRFTAKHARRWTGARVVNTALGTVSFLALEAIGGAITLSYGFTHSWWAIVTVCTLIFFSGIPICYYASKYGVDIDLLSRGAGFGYIGSTISSLIYASFTFIFFALEAAIMSMALELLFDMPLSIAYVISAVVVIPLVTHGFSMISRFQLITQPLWIALQILPFAFVAYHQGDAFAEWLRYESAASRTSGAGFNVLLFGAAAAVVFPLMAQIGEQVDFLRFLPENRKQHKRWWLAVIFAGPGWVFFGVLKLLAGSFLAVFALQHGVIPELADDPAHMYQVAFGYLTESPQIALWLAGFFVIISQLKINVTNAYAGSIAWSNFFSRITHHHPGRVVWLFFNVAIALSLMELGIYQAFEQILNIYAVVVVSWVSSLVADLVINKPLGLSPKHIEFKRGHLYDINPVGLGSMLLASLAGILSHWGLFGETCQALSSFIAFSLPFVTAPLIAVLTRSRFYLCRDESCRDESFRDESCCSTNFYHDELITTDKLFTTSKPITTDKPITDKQQCSICANSFDPEDSSYCPAYQAPICSLCCALESRCEDLCRPTAHANAQIRNFFALFLPLAFLDRLRSDVMQFFLLFTSIATFLFILLGLVFYQSSLSQPDAQAIVQQVLIQSYFLLMILTGVLIWLYVLAQKSRQSALQESRQQTQLLFDEIQAHEATSQQLQQAKEAAESANQAKSRYLSGVSHELRTPLNSVLGYAQLMESKNSLDERTREYAAVIRRSGEHLTNVIESLLEISRIEAGRLTLHRDHVRLPQFLEHLVEMFRLQATQKGIEFRHAFHNLPDCVATDEKRLQQILINLLSNAIKFTPSGEVFFSVSFRNEIARFTVKDTGIGIADTDLQRIFEPFERSQNPHSAGIPGTGLGLSITRLLTDLMGGDIKIKSSGSTGSEFSLKLMLPAIDLSSKGRTSIQPTSMQINNYRGPTQHLMVVDDDVNHRALINDLLTPKGFVIHQAHNAEQCLAQFTDVRIDLLLLDVSMPGMDGWQLATVLRSLGYNQPIIMVSANPREDKWSSVYDDYLAKPVHLDQLLEKIGQLLQLEWKFSSDSTSVNSTSINSIGANSASNITYQSSASHDRKVNTQADSTGNQQGLVLSDELIASFQGLLDDARIGHLSGVQHTLQEIAKATQIPRHTMLELKRLADSCNMPRLVTYLESLLKEHKPHEK